MLEGIFPPATTNSEDSFPRDTSQHGTQYRGVDIVWMFDDRYMDPAPEITGHSEETKIRVRLC